MSLSSQHHLGNTYRRLFEANGTKASMNTRRTTTVDIKSAWRKLLFHNSSNDWLCVSSLSCYKAGDCFFMGPGGEIYS